MMIPVPPKCKNWVGIRVVAKTYGDRAISAKKIPPANVIRVNTLSRYSAVMSAVARDKPPFFFRLFATRPG